MKRLAPEPNSNNNGNYLSLQTNTLARTCAHAHVCLVASAFVLFVLWLAFDLVCIVVSQSVCACFPWRELEDVRTFFCLECPSSPLNNRHALRQTDNVLCKYANKRKMTHVCFCRCKALDSNSTSLAPWSFIVQSYLQKRMQRSKHIWSLKEDHSRHRPNSRQGSSSVADSAICGSVFSISGTLFFLSSFPL